MRFTSMIYMIYEWACFRMKCPFVVPKWLLSGESRTPHLDTFPICLKVGMNTINKVRSRKPLITFGYDVESSLWTSIFWHVNLEHRWVVGWLLEVVLDDHVHHAGTNRGLSDGSKMFKGSNITHKVFQPPLVCQNISRLARKVSQA